MNVRGPGDARQGGPERVVVLRQVGLLRWRRRGDEATGRGRRGKTECRDLKHRTLSETVNHINYYRLSLKSVVYQDL